MRYDYNCEKCGIFEVVQSIHDDSILSCPKCNSPVERVITGGLYYFDSTPRTLGSQAERNSSVNRGEVSELEHKDTPKRPWWRDSKPDPHLSKMTETEKATYVKTGRKPAGLKKRVQSDLL